MSCDPNDECCKTCALVNLGSAFESGKTWSGRTWSLTSIVEGTPCLLCRVLYWAFQNTPGHEELMDGYATGTTHTVRLNPALRGLSWVFESATSGKTRRNSPYSLIPTTGNQVFRRAKCSSFESELVRKWLDHCDSAHDCVTRHMKRVEFDMRVIDVENDCVVHAPENCTYTALSYVWGNVKQPLLMTHNVKRYGIPGSLRKLQLPKTIRDVMNVCRSLGLRYLWVDSLTILQDLIGHSNDQVAHMHDIYRSAYLTIVVASGLDCASAIPSIEKRSPVQYTATIQSIAVGTILKSLEPLEDRVRESVWNQRAWTMQEYALSRRCLIFTSHEHFLDCGRGASVETFAGGLLQSRESFAPYLLDSRLPFESGHNLILRSYARAVHLYLMRSMSYPNDILRAFDGMAHALTPYIGPSWWGSPHRAFRYSLCWMNNEPLVKREGFPSWSWAGWSPPPGLVSRKGPTAFPSFGASPLWPHCSIYRWRSQTFMEPFLHKYKFEIFDWPEKPNFSVVPETHPQVSLFRWMYEQPCCVEEKYRNWIYDIVFESRAPLFHRLSQVPLDFVLTFLSCIARFPRDTVKQSCITIISHTTDVPSVVSPEGDGSYTVSHSGFEGATGPVHFILVGHVALTTPRVVVLPIDIDIIEIGQDGEADEVVARRQGNPVLMEEADWFAVAHSCIVHLW